MLETGSSVKGYYPENHRAFNIIGDDFSSMINILSALHATGLMIKLLCVKSV